MEQQNNKDIVINYTFEYAPTLWKFYNSNKKVPYVRGCRGSGKSSVCVQKLIKNGREQMPSPIDGIRRTRFAIIRNCYDDKTEILTDKRGWVLFKDLSINDKVATKHNNELIFEYPTYYYSDKYNGEMIKVENENLDLCVTPDHRMYVCVKNGITKERSLYKFETANDIFGLTNREFKINIENWNGMEVPYTEDWFEFFGIWFAEGNADIYNGRYHLIISQKKYTEYLEDILKRIGLEYYKSDKGNKNYNYRIYINDDVRDLIRLLMEFGKSKNKWIPWWIKNAPKKHLNAFLHGFIMGDGHYRKNKHDTTRMSTSSCQLASDLQEIAFRAGYATTITHTGKMWNITLLTEIRSTPQPKKEHWEKIQYNGNVYCVEVSTHIIYVRRNGKPVWCSQTYSQLKDSSIRKTFEWYPEEHFGHYNKTDKNYIITAFKDTEIELSFRALDRPEDVRNLLSLELSGAWINESREIPKAIFDNLDVSVGRYPAYKDGGCTLPQILMDTNSPDEDSWLYRLFEENLPKDIKLQEKFEQFVQPGGLSEDAENVPFLPGGRKYYEDGIVGKDTDWIKVYINNEYGFVKEGECVYEGRWSDSLHMAKEELYPLKGFPIIVGLDIGGLCPAAIIGQVVPRGYLHILEEYISEEMGIQRFAMNILKPLFATKYRGCKIILTGDPAGTSRVATDESTCYNELMKIFPGMEIKPAFTNSLPARIGAVEYFLTNYIDLGTPSLQMNKSCKVLRKGFNKGYVKDKMGNPKKNECSHPHDALQYLCLFLKEEMGRFSKKKVSRRQEYEAPTSIGL